MIFIRDEPVHDQAEMAVYQQKTRQNPERFDMKPLAVYGAIDAVEGPAPDGIVLMQFRDVAEAKAWYHSPGYQAAVPHRLRAADYRAVIVEGLQTSRAQE
jgi:uncharacterized protein (DUF1330 family)